MSVGILSLDWFTIATSYVIIAIYVCILLYKKITWFLSNNILSTTYYITKLVKIYNITFLVRVIGSCLLSKIFIFDYDFIQEIKPILWAKKQIKKKTSLSWVLWFLELSFNLASCVMYRKHKLFIVVFYSQNIFTKLLINLKGNLLKS